MVYSYRYAITGFAAMLTRQEVTAMEAMKGFLRAEPDRRLALHTTYTPTFLGLERGSGLWQRTNYGEGIIIGVVDGGVLPSHPSFKDDGVPPPPPPHRWRGRCDFNASECNNKLIGAKVFLGGSKKPYDNYGHGTHVASIAAGNFVDNAHVLGNARGTAAGIAPKAHLAIYRSCQFGYCDMSNALAAVEEAIRDGVDVLSMSLGDFTVKDFYENSFMVAAFRAMDRGILLCGCAGNSGAIKSGIENDAPWILTVGASTIDRRITSTVRLGNGMEFDGESGFPPTAFNSTITMLPVVNAYDCTKPDLEHRNFTGKLVLCSLRIPKILKKSEVVRDAGGAAMVVVNVPSYNTTSAEQTVLPTVNVIDESYEIYAYQGELGVHPTASIVFKGTRFGFRPSPTVADFSSRGPSQVNGGIPKPDIVAPGANILAAWHAQVGPDNTGSTTPKFNFLSGTSMATPHVAGVAALVKKAHPNWSPAAIKSAIMTTASKLDLQGNPIKDDNTNNGDASVFAMGAGQVNPSAATDPGLVYDLQSGDYLRYLCGLGYDDVDISYIADREVQCSTIGSITAEELNYPFMAVSLGSTSRKTITRTVTNVGEASSTYSAKIDKPKGVKVHVKPNKIEFKNSNERKIFELKFEHEGTPITKDAVLEGQLSWVSEKHVVKSPIVVTLT